MPDRVLGGRPRVQELMDQWRYVEPVAWRAIYRFHGCVVSSLWSNPVDAQRELDSRRGPEYSEHEIVALFDKSPNSYADELAALLAAPAALPQEKEE